MRWNRDTIAPSKRSASGWARHIRSYVVGTGVRDARTGVETKDVDGVLNGDIDQFLRAALTEKLADGRDPASQCHKHPTD